MHCYTETKQIQLHLCIKPIHIFTLLLLYDSKKLVIIMLYIIWKKNMKENEKTFKPKINSNPLSLCMMYNRVVENSTSHVLVESIYVFASM